MKCQKYKTNEANAYEPFTNLCKKCATEEINKVCDSADLEMGGIENE